MIFFTSACDLPQKEQSVMRDDLAMAKESANYRARVDGGNYARSGGRFDRQVLGFAGGGDNVIHDPVVLRLQGAHVVIPIGILLDLLLALARMAGDHLAQGAAPAQDLLGR